MTILSDAERAAIHSVASGERSQLAEATAAFERAALEHDVEACVELKFMSEQLAPVPDLTLRARYRKAVLVQPK